MAVQKLNALRSFTVVTVYAVDNLNTKKSVHFEDILLTSTVFLNWYENQIIAKYIARIPPQKKRIY